jgi:hypothetical protein
MGTFILPAQKMSENGMAILVTDGLDGDVLAVIESGIRYPPIK